MLVWSTSKQVSMRLSPKVQLFDEKPLVLAIGRVMSAAPGKCLVTLLERVTSATSSPACW
ncbi:MAG: hypothetical protein ABTQ32_26410 [Myxococcaceae bacterium]